MSTHDANHDVCVKLRRKNAELCLKEEILSQLRKFHELQLSLPTFDLLIDDDI